MARKFKKRIFFQMARAGKMLQPIKPARVFYWRIIWTVTREKIWQVIYIIFLSFPPPPGGGNFLKEKFYE